MGNEENFKYNRKSGEKDKAFMNLDEAREFGINIENLGRKLRKLGKKHNTQELSICGMHLIELAQIDYYRKKTSRNYIAFKEIPAELLRLVRMIEKSDHSPP